MARFGSLDTQYFDDAGDPLVSGKIYFYETGTTTPKNTYADVNYTILNANPVILTAAGRQPNIFFDGVAKAILTKSDNTQILVRDPVGETESNFGDAWISTKTYQANDVVKGSNGEFYRSLVNNNINNDPVTTTGSWTFLYSVEWSAGTTYKLGSVVTRNQLFYQSLQNANINKDPLTENTWWVPIQLVWSATATYGLSANVVGTDGILYTSIQAANINNPPATSPAWWIVSAASLTTVTVPFGGTGRTSLTANNLIVGNGTSAVQFVAPGASGNVLTSNGTTWQSTAPSTAIIGYTSRLTTTAFAGGTLNTTAATAYDMDGDIEIIVGANSSGNVVAVAHKNSTDAFGSPLVVRATNCAVGNIVAIKHTSTQLLVVSCTAVSTALEAVVVSLNTGTLALTANTAATATLSGNTSGFISRNGIVAVPSLPNSFVINYNVATPARQVRAISISGTTVTIGSEAAPSGNSDLTVVATGDKIIVASYSTSLNSIYTTPYTVSGSTLTAGTGTTTSVAGSPLINKFFALGTRFCLIYLDNSAQTVIGGIVTLTGTTTTISTATLISAGAANGYWDCIAVSSSKVFVVSASSTAGQGANILTDSSGTASAGTAVSTLSINFNTRRSCAYLDGTNVIVQEFLTGTPGSYNIISFDCSGSSPAINKTLLQAVPAVNTMFEVNAGTNTPALARNRANFYGTGYGYAIRNQSNTGSGLASFETRIGSSGLLFYPLVAVLPIGSVGRNDRENWVATGNELIKMELLA